MKREEEQPRERVRLSINSCCALTSRHRIHFGLIRNFLELPPLWVLLVQVENECASRCYSSLVLCELSCGKLWPYWLSLRQTEARRRYIISDSCEARLVEICRPCVTGAMRRHTEQTSTKGIIGNLETMILNSVFR